MAEVRNSRARILLIIAVLAAGCGKDPDVAKREFVKSGDELMAQKKYQEAIVQLRNAVQLDPNFGEARLKLADAFAGAGDAVNAFREYVRAADLMPGDLRAQLTSGALLLMAGQFEDAQARADKALAVDAKSVDALILRANALAGLKKMDEALKQAEEAVRADPSKGTAYSAVGALRLMRGERAKAESLFREAVERDAKSVPAKLALAQFLWATGRRNEAEAQMKAVIELEPQNVLAHRGLALFALESGRIGEAEPHVKALANAMPNGQLVLADYYLNSGRSAEAVPILDRAASPGSSTFVGAKLRLAAMARAKGETAEAAMVVGQALEKEPSNPEALVMKAALLAEQKKLGEAISTARVAAESNPGSAVAHFALGRLQGQHGDFDEAIKSFTKVVQLNPQVVAADLALSQLHLALRHLPDAESFARSAMTKAPNLLDARLALAKVQLAKGNSGEAEPILRDIVARAPKSAVAHAQLGRLELAKKNGKAARAAFERALTLSPLDADALGGLAYLDLQAGRPDAATKRLKAALESSPKDVRLLMLSAKAHAAVRDLATSEKLLKQVIEIDPASIDAYGLLVAIYETQGRSDQALVELETLSKERPTLASTHTVRGVILQGKNRRAEAKAAYRKALGLDSTAAVSANNLAWMMAEDNENLDEALQLAQAARAQAPDSAAIADTLGWVFLKKGQPDSAIPPLQDATRDEPDNAGYQYHLGFAYAKRGDIKLARASLEKALKLAPADSQAKEARDTLAFIKTLGA